MASGAGFPEQLQKQSRTKKPSKRMAFLLMTVGLLLRLFKESAFLQLDKQVFSAEKCAKFWENPVRFFEVDQSGLFQHFLLTELAGEKRSELDYFLRLSEFFPWCQISPKKSATIP
ncbi:MAG: hypothetical protein P8130_03255 [Deltaproteobacteria bacterium]